MRGMYDVPVQYTVNTYSHVTPTIILILVINVVCSGQGFTGLKLSMLVVNKSFIRLAHHFYGTRYTYSCAAKAAAGMLAHAQGGL